jgi:regulator of replication initiation timing
MSDENTRLHQQAVVRLLHEHSHFMHDILEAVRALKPAPKSAADYEYTVSRELYPTLMAERDALQAEVERLRAHVEEMQPLLGKQKDEIERLRAENERLKEKLGTVAIAARGNLSGYEADLDSHALQEVLKIHAELKRFREREAGPMAKLFAALARLPQCEDCREIPGYGVGPVTVENSDFVRVRDALAAVRDFEVTT